MYFTSLFGNFVILIYLGENMEKCKYQVSYSYPFKNIISGKREIQQMNEIIENEICCDVDTITNGWQFYQNNKCVVNLVQSITYDIIVRVAIGINVIDNKRV